MDKVEAHVVQLSDENSSHALKEGGAIHVDGCADGQDKAADVLGHAVIFLHALHHEGQRGRAEEQETVWVSNGEQKVCRESLEKLR